MKDPAEKKDIIKAEWVNVIATVGCFVAMLSIVVGMFLSLSTKMDNFHTEMRDVHGRLSRTEAVLGF